MTAGPIAPAGTVLARIEDLADGATKGFTLGNGDWPLRGLLVRVGDAVGAFVNRCPHAGHRLNFMPDRFLTQDGSLILCQSHGALFDKVTGDCVAGPCTGEALTRIAVRTVDGEIRLATDLDIDAVAQRPW